MMALLLRVNGKCVRGNGKKAKTVPIIAVLNTGLEKKRTIAVRVVDIFGNDAGATIEVKA